MECLIINENKLKIMLSAEEVVSYGIDSEGSDYSDPEIRRAFWKILDRAREVCGFKVSGEKLLIQYYPSKSGSEMFVTKLGKISLGVEKSISKSDSVTMLSSKNMIYRFESIEDLERLCREMKNKISDFSSETYSSDDGCYYLFFEERSDSTFLSRFSLAAEFGEEIPQNMDSYIREHGDRITL